MTSIGTRTFAEQLVYTWAATCLDGARGFGITGISDGLRDRLPAIKAQVRDLSRFEPRASESPDELRGYRHLERRILGEDAYLISKTCQGRTADGRAGNFCAQLIIAPKTELTASLCVALSDAEFWIRPYHAADITAAHLSPVDLGIGDSESAGQGKVAQQLLREAIEDGWSLSLGDAELDNVRQVLGVLHPGTDVDATFAFETNHGSSSLSLGLDLGVGTVPTNSRGRLTHGDPDWLQLRTRLHDLPSPDRARTVFNLYYPAHSIGRKATAAGTGAHHAQRADEDLPELKAYLRGDSSPLASLLDPRSAGSLELCVGVVQYLSTNNVGLNCATTASIELSGQLVACAEPHLDAAEVDRVLPRDSEALHRLANQLISPAILRGLSRDTATSARSSICPEFVTMADNLWPTLRTVWVDRAARAPLAQAIRHGASSAGSLFQTLMTAEPVDIEFLFEDLFPAVWGDEEEAAQILYSLCWTQYVEWSGTPSYYANVLSHRRRARWIPALLRRGR